MHPDHLDLVNDYLKYLESVRLPYIPTNTNEAKASQAELDARLRDDSHDDVWDGLDILKFLTGSNKRLKLTGNRIKMFVALRLPPRFLAA